MYMRVWCMRIRVRERKIWLSKYLTIPSYLFATTAASNWTTNPTQPVISSICYFYHLKTFTFAIWKKSDQFPSSDYSIR